MVIAAAIPSANDLSQNHTFALPCRLDMLTVGEHVGHHGELVMQRRVRPQELVDLVRDRALPPPLDERVEQQLVTPYPRTHHQRDINQHGCAGLTVGVLLPPVQLIVDGERHSLLEATLRVRRPADNVATHLQTKRHIEVFGHVRLGPDLLLTICGIHERSILQCFPAKEGIVADEGRDLTVRATCIR